MTNVRRGLLLAAMATLAACSRSGSADGIGVTPQGAGPAGATATITIQNFTYLPAKIKIEAGTTVVWINRDHVRHSATAKNLAFNSPGLVFDASWGHRFVKPGTYAFYCRYHPYMTGQVVVSPKPQ